MRKMNPTSQTSSSSGHSSRKYYAASKSAGKSSSHHSSGKCSTTEKRNSYPYRRVYFDKNPGLLFGHLWFCSQCHKPIWSKEKVVVDHIVPLNKGGINHHLNCVAICNKCNLRKSDKVDYRIAVGFASKAVESSVQVSKNIVKTSLKCVYSVVSKVFGTVFGLIGSYAPLRILFIIGLLIGICIFASKFFI